MNIRGKQQLRERLASEYVLGTLKGGARRRFEGWMHGDAALRRTVAEWQGRLMPLAEFSAAQVPRAQVWRNIEARLNLPPARSGLASWWAGSPGFWRTLGLASSALAAVLVVVMATRTVETPVIDHVATLTDASSQAALVLTADSRHQTLDVKVVSGVAVPSEKTLQLWAISKAGKPRSLGILPDKRSARLVLTASAIGSDVALLAISLEPKGGSPDPNGPTGPVLYKGNWVRVL